MNITEAFNLAISNVHANRFRSFLTMLGMIVGVASIIAVITIGGGARRSMEEHYARIGLANISITGGNSRTPLNMETYDYLVANCPSVSTWFSTGSFTETLISGEAPFYIYLAVPNQIKAQDWPVAVGSFITPEHIRRSSKVIVLGKGLAETL